MNRNKIRLDWYWTQVNALVVTSEISKRATTYKLLLLYILHVDLKNKNETATKKKTETQPKQTSMCLKQGEVNERKEKKTAWTLRHWGQWRINGRGAAGFVCAEPITSPTHSCAHTGKWMDIAFATLANTSTHPSKRWSACRFTVPSYICIYFL